MGEVKHLQKKIVIPGDLVTDGRKKVGQHVFVEQGKIYSDALGITCPEAPVASVVALHGKYKPYRNDLIVGIVANETMNGYIVDINSFYHSFISKKFFREPLKRGSVISAKIAEVNEINEADLEDIRVFYDGEVIEVSSVKVPRIIGKNGSMLEVLKQATKCDLLIGRNGWVWVKNGDTKLLLEAVRLIEREAHLSNLTKRIELFLKEKKKVN